MAFGDHKDIMQINEGITIQHNDIVTSYKEWSQYYYKSAQLAAKNIIDNTSDNIIIDCNSLPALYMYRQSLELLLKAKILNDYGKEKSKELFDDYKHDLEQLFGNIDKTNLQLKHRDAWFVKFFKNINNFDYNSDLFRYPFSKEFLDQYDNRALDTPTMFELLSCAYEILYASFFDESNCNETEIEECIDYINSKSRNGEYIHLAQHGLGYCHVWQMKEKDAFKQVRGYHNVANLLYKRYCHTQSVAYFIPMVFMYRNLIELVIKDIGQNLHSYIKNEIEQDYLTTIPPKYLKTHKIKKGLWKNYKIIFTAFAENYDWDPRELDTIEDYIQSLDKFDKHSDRFRYPTDKNLQYQHTVEYDPETIHLFMEELYQIFDGMIMVLQEASDNVNDMLSEYASYEDFH